MPSTDTAYCLLAFEDQKSATSGAVQIMQNDEKGKK